MLSSSILQAKCEQCPGLCRKVHILNNRIFCGECCGEVLVLGMDMRECYVELYLFFDKICVYKIKAVILHAIMSEVYFAIINKQTTYHYGKLQRFRSGEHS